MMISGDKPVIIEGRKSLEGIWKEWVDAERRLCTGKRLTKKQAGIVDFVAETCDISVVIEKGATFFRARRIKEQSLSRRGRYHGLDKSDCMAPKPRAVKRMGRFNCRHESVLYMSEEPYTALAELRPGKKSLVNVAELRLPRNVTLADFTYDGEDADDGVDEAARVLRRMALACYLVVHHDRERYRITQHIGQRIRALGYDGIRYSSSLSPNGRNVVLFHTAKAQAVGSFVYRTDAVLYYARQIRPGSAKILMPNALGAASRDELAAFLTGILRTPN
jgi:RES domain-containing protein